MLNKLPELDARMASTAIKRAALEKLWLNLWTPNPLPEKELAMFNRLHDFFSRGGLAKHHTAEAQYKAIEELYEEIFGDSPP